MSQNTLNIFQPFRNEVFFFLVHGLSENEVGRIRPMGRGLPTPALSHRVEFLLLNSFRTGIWLLNLKSPLK